MEEGWTLLDGEDNSEMHQEPLVELGHPEPLLLPGETVIVPFPRVTECSGPVSSCGCLFVTNYQLIFVPEV